jgi:hypothetical protein
MGSRRKRVLSQMLWLHRSQRRKGILTSEQSAAGIVSRETVVGFTKKEMGATAPIEKGASILTEKKVKTKFIISILTTEL